MVLGRAIAGLGGAGMTSLVSVLIAGMVSYLLLSLTSING